MNGCFSSLLVRRLSSQDAASEESPLSTAPDALSFSWRKVENLCIVKGFTYKDVRSPPEVGSV